MSEERSNETRPDADRVESVREQLVRLGYLTSRVDRYFLDGVEARGSRARQVLRGVLRGAWPLAVILAAGHALLLIAHHPLDSARPLDGLILAGYLVVPALGAAAVLLTACGALGAALIARGRRHDPAVLARSFSIAAAVVATPCAVASVALAPTAPWPALAGRAVLLAAIVFAGERFLYDELLATFVTLENQAPRGRRTATVKLAALALVAVGGAALVVPAVLPEAPREAAVERPAIVPASARCAVVAVDGWDEAEARHLIAEGRLPALGRLLEQSWQWEHARASGPAAEAWTTLWTGVPAERHGIRDHDWTRPLGCRRALLTTGYLSPWIDRALPALGLAERGAATSTLRSAATLWEITSWIGYRTLQVGNWGTVPITPLLGRNVSQQAAVKLRRGQSISDEVEPPDLEEAVQAATADIPDDLTDAEWIDRFHAELFGQLWAERREAIGAVYFPGLDLLRHPVTADGEVNLLRRAESAIRSYEAVDALVSELLNEVDRGEAWLVVVADPGRDAGSRRGRVLVTGPQDATRSPTDGAATAEDLLPTVLTLLDVPLAEELTGTSLISPPQVATLPGYPRPRATDAGGRSADYLESLRALGYVR